jgi:hypothetical protein
MAFGTATTLSFADPETTAEAIRGLDALLDEAAGREGFLSGHLLQVSETELLLVTIYASEESAESLSAALRPRLAEAIGPLVDGPPHRAAGPVVADTGA